MVFLLYTIITILVVCAEYYAWKVLTPNLFVIVPLYFICLVCELLGEGFGFVSVIDSVYYSFITFSLIGAAASLMTSIVIPSHLLKKSVAQSTSVFPKLKNTNVITVILSASVIVSILYAYQIYRGLGTISGESYGDSMSSGVVGHALNLCMIAAPILLFSQVRVSFFHVLLIVAVGVLLFLKQVKGWLIVPIVFYFFMAYYSSVGNKISWLKKTLWVSLLGVLLVFVFFGVYFIGFVSQVGLENALTQISYFFSIISMHFLSYLFSGILGYSAFFKGADTSYQQIHYLFLMPYNVYQYLIGSPLVGSVSSEFNTINNAFDKMSNVYTIFGTLYFRAGWLGGGIYFIVICFLSTLLRFSFVSIPVLFVYCYLSSFLLLGWFDYYYSSLAVYEGCIFILIICFLSKLRLKV